MSTFRENRPYIYVHNSESRGKYIKSMKGLEH